MWFSYLLCFVGLILLIFSAVFFARKSAMNQEVSEPHNKLSSVAVPVTDGQ
jgi:hypothetical protein